MGVFTDDFKVLMISAMDFPRAGPPRNIRDDLAFSLAWMRTCTTKVFRKLGRFLWCQEGFSVQEGLSGQKGLSGIGKICQARKASKARKGFCVRKVFRGKEGFSWERIVSQGPGRLYFVTAFACYFPRAVLNMKLL